MPPPVAQFSRDAQGIRFAPRFEQLSRVLNSPARSLQIDSQPDMLAPERLLVFEVRSSIDAFINAARRVDGLEFVDEEELDGDSEDKNPCLYLLIPDLRALNQIYGLWQRWVAGESLPRNFGRWALLFSTLRDLRPWGPKDRIDEAEISFLTHLISDHEDDDLINVEIELVFRRETEKSVEVERSITNFITELGGEVISRCRIEDINYHALLVSLKVSEIKRIIELSPDGILGFDPIMYIRPQSVATTLELEASHSISLEQEIQVDDQNPILALLDGVPVASHPRLKDRLDVLDEFDLEAITPVGGRKHGTSMASLILHGDLNSNNKPLTKKLLHIPVLGVGDEFPGNRLIVDVIYQAIYAIKSGVNPSLENVLIVNLSLGNSRKVFHGLMSPWARLLDRLAYKYGLLFIVSAGNHKDPIKLSSTNTYTDFEDSSPQDKSKTLIRSLGEVASNRRLLSPAESINSITVGAANIRHDVAGQSQAGAHQINPYEGVTISNPSSALGPGYGGGTKPDILMPGGRELISQHSSGGGVVIVNASSQFGLSGIKVAAPQIQAGVNQEGLVGGTSVATALASRTCHLIYDSLESSYGEEFTNLSALKKVVILKALMSHAAKWTDSASLIKEAIGPFDGKRHVEQKDNIRRFLGYGLVEEDKAVSSAEDRVTFWAHAALLPAQECIFEIPLPMCMNAIARPHSVRATVAWIAPVTAGRKSYRAVRMNLLDLGEKESLRVSSVSTQPDMNQAKKGTVISRIWEGSRAPQIVNGQVLTLTVQRENDQGAAIDEAIEFGLAVTIEMAGVIQIFDEIAVRVGLPVKIRV